MKREMAKGPPNFYDNDFTQVCTVDVKIPKPGESRCCMSLPIATYVSCAIPAIPHVLSCLVSVVSLICFAASPAVQLPEAFHSRSSPRPRHVACLEHVL